MPAAPAAAPDRAVAAPAAPATVAGPLRQLLAGCLAAIVTLAPLLTLGVLAYAGLGADAAALGMPAAFVGVAVGGAAFAFAGRSAVPVAGIGSVGVVVFAGLVTRLAGDAAATSAAVVACMGLVVVGSGLLQMAFGACGFGSLAKYTPHPVIAGFLNAAAILIVLGQVPMLLGLTTQAWRSGAAGWRDAQLPALLLAAATAASIALVARRWPRLPSVVVGLGIGCAIHAALHAAVPGLALGAVAGSLRAALPAAGAWQQLVDGAASQLIAAHAADLATTSALLAILNALAGVISGLAVDERLGDRHDPNRQLVAIGLSNVAAGLVCGLPLTYSDTRAAAIVHAGGRGRTPALAQAAATGLVLLVFGSAMAWLPLPVLAGVMVVVGIGLVDRWTVGQLRAVLLRGARDRERLGNLALVALVAGAVLGFGFLAGVALGVLASMALFIRALARALVRERYDARARPSRRLYAGDAETLLAARRDRIAVRVLEGALFFGSVERLVDEADALPQRTAALVVDLGRVTTIDVSGAVALLRLSDRLARRGTQLLLAGVAAARDAAPEADGSSTLVPVADPAPRATAHAESLRAAGARRALLARCFADADLATEAAERLLLDATPFAGATAVPLAACDLLAGATAAQVETVRVRLEARTLGAGDILFRAGDPGDAIYVLSAGSISIVALDAADRATHRYVSFSPALMFGETALLDGAGRSAAARADVDGTVVHRLSQAALDALVAADAALGVLLYRNIGAHLSKRLRAASAAWSAASR